MSLLLYHCFPGYLSASRRIPTRDATSLEQLRCQIGYLTLKSILETGLLLTPERFSVRNSDHLHTKNRFGFWDLMPTNPYSNREAREQFQMTQVRACFTLATPSELKRKIAGLRYSSSHYEGANIPPWSHFDLFGDFAIGLDPIEARALGAIPTIYYYRDVVDSESPLSSYGTSSTLSFELISRLLEARKLLVALAHIEALADSNCEDTRTIKQLREMGQNLDDEPDCVIKAASRLSENLAKQIYPLFDTNRVPIANIIEHIELLLSLFQVADSQRNRPLAYFQQKEWRIIQHNKQGLNCEPLLGKQYSQGSSKKIQKLRSYLSEIDRLLEEPRFQTMFKNRENTDGFWLLMNCNRFNFRDFIKQIIVPDSALEPTKELISTFDFWNAPTIISHSQITED